MGTSSSTQVKTLLCVILLQLLFILFPIPGVSSSGQAGSFSMVLGNSGSGQGAAVSLVAGAATNGRGGPVYISSGGGSSSTNSGDLTVLTGDSSSGR